MEYVYVGKLVNTHGLKGEVKLLSNFDYKDYYFKKGIHFYIGDNKKKLQLVVIDIIKCLICFYLMSIIILMMF